MSDTHLDLRRRFYADELDALCAFRTAGLAGSFASVPHGPEGRCGSRGSIKTLRRDAHEPSESCWLHAPGACLSL